MFVHNYGNTCTQMHTMILLKHIPPPYLPFSQLLIYAVPSAPPQSLTITTVFATTVDLQWNHVPCLEQNSRLENYIVRYTACSTNEACIVLNSHSFEVTLDASSSTNVTLTGLSPYTNYSIQVASVNSEDEEGPATPATVVETLQSCKYTFQHMYIIAIINFSVQS